MYATFAMHTIAACVTVTQCASNFVRTIVLTMVDIRIIFVTIITALNVPISRCNLGGATNPLQNRKWQKETEGMTLFPKEILDSKKTLF